MKAFYQAPFIGARASRGRTIARAVLVRRRNHQRLFPVDSQTESNLALQSQDFLFAK